MNPVVRPAAPDDLAEIVRVHLEAFPEFFLTTLGSKFLTVLYQGFLATATGMLLVASNDNRVVGFVAGTQKPELFFRELLWVRGFRLVLAAAGAALRHPLSVLPRLAQALVYRGERPQRLHNAALLSSLAVDPGTAGAGVGGVLVRSFCLAAADAGCDHVYLTTDRDGNEAVQRFYTRLGFHLGGEIQRQQGRQMSLYVRDLARSSQEVRG